MNGLVVSTVARNDVSDDLKVRGQSRETTHALKDGCKTLKNRYETVLASREAMFAATKSLQEKYLHHYANPTEEMLLG